jgi:starch synthase
VGFGLCFDNATVQEAVMSVSRAVGWYYNAPEILSEARSRMMQIDHSWERSAQEYIDLYNSVL